MDLLKTQLERIQKQLAGLNATQKMLVAALAAIMVITVVWWGKYAGDAEMVALLPQQSLSVGDMGPIQDRLSMKGIPFTVSGDKVLVPADRRMEILADLTYARAMPRNMQVGFDEIVKQMSPFDSQDKQLRIWNHGKEAALSQMIGQWPGVAQADVIIDATNQPRVEGSIVPSATVNITMREGARVPSTLADTAADFVSGSCAGLEAGRVKVVIDGHRGRVHGAQDAFASGDEQLDTLQHSEDVAEAKIRNSFGEIPDLHVAVTMKLNTSTVQSEKHVVDPKGSFTKVLQSNTETDTTNGPAAGGEAGAVPNTAVSVNGSGGASSSGGVTQVHEKTEEKSQLVTSDERTTSSTPAGDTTPVSATVRFPMSHFIAIEQLQTGSKQIPTLAQLQPLIDSKLQEFRQTIANTLGMPSTDKISVYAYIDTVPTLGTPPVASTSAAGMSLMVSGHAKEIALGTLALMSLFMASMMVRKAAPAPLPAAVAASVSGADRPTVAGLLGGTGEALAGEAGDGEGHLEGMELSDDTIKAGRMVDQVSTLVREDPDAAAALVKRWLGR